MKVSLYTPTREFSADIMDALRIFIGPAEEIIEETGGDIVLRHTEHVENCARICRVELSGLYQGADQSAVALEKEPLVEKRLHKRQIKTLIYGLMKKATGFHPPWGSMTGIRPTRLCYMEMENGLPLEQAVERVQRIFDLSAEKASLLGDVISTQGSLAPQKKGEIDLYIGIPFCVSRCAYCSFLSGEVGNGSRLEPYVEALEEEMRLVTALMKERHLTPRAFYMGGGTPTALPVPLFKRVLAGAAEMMEPCREKTIEAGRPDTLDREMLGVIQGAHVGRISINPQTMHDETLKRIGRRHTRAQTEQAYALARDMGFSHINMDLIAGLPGENLSMFCDTLSWSKTMNPESLTVHTLCIKRTSLMHSWASALPPGDMVAQMVRLGREDAAARGMHPYYLYRQKYMAGNLENVGYALPGHESLYNVGMMEETANVLAMGAGGISKRVDTATGLISRAPNVSDVGVYIARVREMAERKKQLLAEE